MSRQPTGTQGELNSTASSRRCVCDDGTDRTGRAERSGFGDRGRSDKGSDRAADVCHGLLDDAVVPARGARPAARGGPRRLTDGARADDHRRVRHGGRALTSRRPGGGPGGAPALSGGPARGGRGRAGADRNGSGLRVPAGRRRARRSAAGAGQPRHEQGDPRRRTACPAWLGDRHEAVGGAVGGVRGRAAARGAGRSHRVAGRCLDRFGRRGGGRRVGGTYAARRPAHEVHMRPSGYRAG